LNESQARQQGYDFTGHYDTDRGKMTQRAAELRREGNKAVVVSVPRNPLSRGTHATGYSVYWIESDVNREKRLYTLREQKIARLSAERDARLREAVELDEQIAAVRAEGGKLMATATKEKRTKVNTVHPPREVRDNTKARRAWLAEELERVNALSGQEGKIVGTGSYQSISVYKVEQVSGRLRHRGSCQFCGNSQVSDRKGMVLHGYQRPGDGYIFGQCPGVGRKPLNQDKTFTERWHAEAVKAEADARAEKAVRESVKTETCRRLYAERDADTSQGWVEMPHPNHRFAVPEQDEEFKRKFKDWAARFPLHAASKRAEAAYESARTAHWQAEQNVRHFTMLLESGIYGTPLTEEVVA
jgi:archaeosine-15-forming tRNA-guanine transglycosylase